MSCFRVGRGSTAQSVLVGLFGDFATQAMLFVGFFGLFGWNACFACLVACFAWNGRWH